MAGEKIIIITIIIIIIIIFGEESRRSGVSFFVYNQTTILAIR